MSDTNMKELAILATKVDWLSNVEGIDSVLTTISRSSRSYDSLPDLSECRNVPYGDALPLYSGFDIGNRYGLWSKEFRENRNISFCFNVYFVSPNTLKCFKVGKDHSIDFNQLEKYLTLPYSEDTPNEFIQLSKFLGSDHYPQMNSIFAHLSLIPEENTDLFLNKFLKLVTFKLSKYTESKFRIFYNVNGKPDKHRGTRYTRYIDLFLMCPDDSISLGREQLANLPIPGAVDDAYDVYCAILNDIKSKEEIKEQTMNNEITLKDSKVEVKETSAENELFNNIKLPIVINGEEYTDSKELGLMNIKIKFYDKNFDPFYIKFDDIPFPLKHFDFNNNLPDYIFKKYVNSCVKGGLSYSLSQIFDGSNIFFDSVYEVEDNVFNINITNVKSVNVPSIEDKAEILKVFKRSVELYIKYYKDYKEPVAEGISEELNEHQNKNRC